MLQCVWVRKVAGRRVLREGKLYNTGDVTYLMGGGHVFFTPFPIMFSWVREHVE
jgi:hypothetical protein